MVTEEKIVVDQQMPEIPGEIAILSSGEEVIYPSMISPLSSSDQKTIRLIDDVASEHKMLGIFPLKSP